MEWRESCATVLCDKLIIPRYRKSQYAFEVTVAVAWYIYILQSYARYTHTHIRGIYALGETTIVEQRGTLGEIVFSTENAAAPRPEQPAVEAHRQIIKRAHRGFDYVNFPARVSHTLENDLNRLQICRFAGSRDRSLQFRKRCRASLLLGEVRCRNCTRVARKITVDVIRPSRNGYLWE